jgi:hypothetical protein
MSLPEQFVMPSLGNVIPQNGQAVYVSQHQGSPFAFNTVKVYNAQKSLELGYEYEDEVDVVTFLVDNNNATKATAVHRCDRNTFREHPEVMADYKRWKDGQKANVTDIRNWKAASYDEIGNCIRSGFMFVEQIAEAPEENLMILGSNYKEIRQKALMHTKAKSDEKDVGKYAELIVDLKREREEDKKVAQELRELCQSLRKELEQSKTVSEETKKQRGRPKKIVDVPDPFEPIAA